MKHAAVLSVFACLASTVSAFSAYAQYNPSAARSAPMQEKKVQTKDAEGRTVETTVLTAPPRDGYGNAASSSYDLAVDGAFEGQTVAVLHFYTSEDFDFHLPKAALKEKGFSVVRWVNAPPSVEELRKGLEKSSQLWLISGDHRLLTDAHIKVIKTFFDAGHGVYIWGDNDPYYADANAVAEALLDASMDGNVPGGKVVGLRTHGKSIGVTEDILLTTGIEHLFEGITIATLHPAGELKPLLYGSAGNLVTSYYDSHGKRAILDGGFTRLYCNWDTAGTARYVKNVAAWLANYERFGKLVVSDRSPTR
jgi:hypothetical protein